MLVIAAVPVAVAEQSATSSHQGQTASIGDQLAALDALTRALAEAGEFAELDSVLERALALREAEFGPDDPRTIHTLIDRTSVLRLLGEPGLPALAELAPRLAKVDPQTLGPRAAEAALSLYHYVVLSTPPHGVRLMYRAVELLKAAGDANAMLENAQAYLAFLLVNADRLVEAGEVLSAVPVEHSFFAGQAVGLALKLRQQGDLDAAAHWIGRLSGLTAAALGERASTVAALANMIGNDLLAGARFDEAERLFGQALALQRELLASDDPDIADTLSNLGTVALAAGRMGKAEGHLREALDIFKAGPARDSTAAAFAMQSLASIVGSDGRHAEAEPLLERALTIAEREGTADHHLRAELGRTKLALNNATEALVHLSSALDAWPSEPEEPGSYRRALALLLNDLGRLEDRLGRISRAEAHFRRALAVIGDGKVASSEPRRSDRANVLGNLSGVLWKSGQLDKAEEVALAALSAKSGRDVDTAGAQLLVRELATGDAGLSDAEALDLIKEVETLALIRQSRGDGVEVLPILRDVVVARRSRLPAVHPDVAGAESNLGQLLLDLGRSREAVARQRRALAAYGDRSSLRGATIRINLAAALRAIGTVGAIEEASSLAEVALSEIERAMGTDPPAAIDAIAEIGALYADLGRLEEAEILLSRVVSAREAQGGNLTDLARAMSNLASLRIAQGRPGEAEALYHQALGMTEGLVPDHHRDRMAQISNLAFALGLQGRHGEALPLQQRALDLQRRSLPPGHPDIARQLNALAATHARLDRLDEARRLADEAMATLERRADPDGPDMAQAFALRGILALMRGADAQTSEARSERASLHHALADLRRATQAGRSPDQRGLPDANSHLPFHVYAAMQAANDANGIHRRALLAEAFEAAQGIKRLGASRAVVAAGARWAAQGSDLEDAVRRYQDVQAAMAGGRQAISASFAEGARHAAGNGQAVERDRLRARLSELEVEAKALAHTIHERFPRYAAVSDPQPLSLDEAQALLAEDEALIVFATSDLSRALPGATGSSVIAVTREKIVARSLPVEDRLLDRVEALRCAAALTDPRCRMPSDSQVVLRGAFSMDGVSLEGMGSATPAAPAFETALAGRVFDETLGPIEDVVADKRHWILVPDSTLGGLPFSLLMQKTSGSGDADRRDWLIRKHALSVLPAATSLRILRGPDAVASQARKAFLGIGDPIIGSRARGAPPMECAQASPLLSAVAAAPSESLVVRSAAGQPLADVAAVRALSALPETRCELKTIARYLAGDTPGAVSLLLGHAANEADLKRLNADGALKDYRVISFATHGLLGDELGGHEAALVLTPPDQATPTDDGLLTAEEIAGLRLDADWVILSACNTAAGRNADDESLSGLASAFLYAGARSLLVSAWPVYSDAAARLTTTALAVQAAAPELGRAEALRRAMLSVLDDPHVTPRELHPAYWAAFSIIGEGGSR